MVLDEFVCDANGTSHSALFGVTRGTFAFIVGQVAETGRLRIDTPVGSIRGRARAGGIGMLSLTALIFSLMKEVHAAEFSAQRPLLDSLDDDTIKPKDLQLSGTIELFMRDGRHYTLDDPSQTIVISGSGSVSVATNSATRMAELQKFQQEALATYALGTITGPTSRGGSGSSTPPSLFLSPQGLQPINFDEPVPQNLRSATTQSAFVSPTILLEAPAPAPSKPPLLTLAVITPMVGNSSVNTAHTLNASGASTGFAINGTTDGVENGQTVTVTIVNSSGVAVQTFTSTVANNAWSVNVSPTNARALSDGNYTVTAEVSNAAGTGTARASQNVTVDQTPPAPPGAALTTDSGSSNSDHITNVGALSLSGIESGATVEYSTNGGTTWTTLFTPVEGFNTVLVRQTDAAGNASGVSTLSFILGTSPPSVTFDTVSFTDTGVQGDHITHNGQVTLSGTVSDNVTVSQLQVFNGSQLLGTAIVDNARHTWTLTTTLAPGAYNQLNATAIDEAGNLANAMTTQTVQVNDAPVLAPISPTLTTITEHQTTNVTNPGQTVSSFVGASISDVDAGAVNGIAITGLTSTNGTWQYSIDGGATWTAIGAVSNSTALLLDASDRIRFLPDGNNGGTDTITYRAWDETAATHGTTADTSTNGGTTAFSTATDTAHLTVISVNDAPVLDARSGSLSYTENQAATAIDTAIAMSDVDSANLAGATVRITGNFVSGQDVLGFSNQNGIAGSYNAATGVLILTGQASVTQYQAALQSVSYFNSSDNPSGQTRTISYQVNDGSAQNNLSNVVTATVAVAPVNDAPVITSGAAAAQVSEEGLANGVPDTLPAGLDTTNSTSASGTITATDVDSDALTMSLGTPSASLTSGGVAIAWTLQNAGHTLVGKAGTATIITVTITDAGTYNVTLSGPIDHATANQEDNTTFAVPVIVSDGHTTTPTTLSVTIEDDSPKAVPVEVSIVPTDSKTNVMLILDLSGSMGTSSGLTGLTRLDVAKAAINELLDQYDNRGDVMVRIVTFSTTGAAVGSAWQSVADAKAAIAGLTAGGNTNYDAALLTAMGAFADGTKLTGPGTQNVSYFLSDGDPTASSDWPQIPGTQLANGIQANEQAVWESLPYDQQNRFLRIRHSQRRYSGEPRSDRLRSGVGRAACRHADHRNRPESAREHSRFYHTARHRRCPGRCCRCTPQLVRRRWRLRAVDYRRWRYLHLQPGGERWSGWHHDQRRRQLHL